MGHTGGVIGIDLGLPEEIIRTIVRQDMAETRDEIKGYCLIIFFVIVSPLYE
jgi:hypothetical protein